MPHILWGFLVRGMAGITSPGHPKCLYSVMVADRLTPLGKRPIIASLSLGATRIFRLKRAAASDAAEGTSIGGTSISGLPRAFQAFSWHMSSRSLGSCQVRRYMFRDPAAYNQLTLLPALILQHAASSVLFLSHSCQML